MIYTNTMDDLISKCNRLTIAVKAKQNELREAISDLAICNSEINIAFQNLKEIERSKETK